ncbi:MAG: hypothetical protein GXP25_10835 [Planctomycetes bacterium]|nr:hypothetical protein [Planctomycetota bacterium]
MRVMKALSVWAVLVLFLMPGFVYADSSKALGDLKQRQLAIRKAVLNIAAEMDVKNTTEKKIRDILYGLSGNEMVAAIQAIEGLGMVKDTERARHLIVALTKSQDKAIEILEKILGVISELEEKAKGEKKEVEGYDLPNDVEEKLKDLRDKLKEFLEDQKKVIDATEDLTKTPVDDFTPDDEQKLKQLEGIEDKWETFLKEAHSDLSKVPEQDFSNPQLLKELNEIYSEVEIAEGALSKKATEIAVAAEQSGAELAETMTTHIEKWLLDEPDRTKWSMEEPLQDYETPMAELPSELEDLIGDLIEEEDDLFEDAEDVSSSWADSLDKGAGWGTADGPISNMSAQGVTGNTLPNNSEIGGRSGEGRSGKSSGEFVGDSAVGKGGRRTPSRLTPDAFEKGVVNDTSTDPTGGATGGGKISGAGGEGLEGPVPPDVSQKMGALAGRQADLRNKAERLRMGFKVMNYPTDTLDKTIQIMKGVEDDLKSGRYRYVTRKKNILLKGLKGSQSFLKGEIAIKKDRSVGLPNFLQDEMIQAKGENAPAGYEDQIEKYYEILSNAK